MNNNLKRTIIVMLSYTPLFTILFTLLRLNLDSGLLFFAGMATMIGTWNLFDFLQKRLLKEGDSP